LIYLFSFYISINFLAFQPKLRFQQFYKDVLKESYNNYLELSTSISNGSLKLEQFDELVKIDERSRIAEKINPKWAAKFEKVLSLSTSDKNLINNRLEQLKIYLELSKVNDIAKVLLEIKKLNGLTGDFSFLNEIAESVYNI
jgi:hypothetical protein